MRILIANRTSLMLGGVEEFIQRISADLDERDHELGFFFESDVGAAPKMLLPNRAKTWSLRGGERPAVPEDIRRWMPSVVYCNGMNSPDLEAALARTAPAAYSAHAYFGTCISGSKMHGFPKRVPCDRRFGAACLVQFFPRRCGGLNPFTMQSLYRTEVHRLDAIKQFGALVVHSAHMRDEYARHGLTASVVTLPVTQAHGRSADRQDTEAFRVLFLGRVSGLKGCDILIDAAERAASRIGPLEIVLAGDGPIVQQLQARARRCMRREPRLKVSFPGWIGPERKVELLRWAHVLAVPSCWPEPYGMVGLEAFSHGVPVVAFGVGGIKDWLADDENGVMVDVRRSVAGFANGLVRISAPATHRRLAEGARKTYERIARRSSADELVAIFERLTLP